MSIIKLNNVKKTYFSGEIETEILHGLSLEIKKGEFVAIMGPSGAGKSTLLHILGFLDNHTEGDYLFDSKNINDYTEKELALTRNEKMGFVFQAFNLLSRTSVLENVKLPLLYSKIPSNTWDDLARKAIDSVGLSHRMEHDPSQLSGGEKQRVAIARALVCNPSVIFADEPTGNLDSHSGVIVMEIIQKLHKEGRTIILITHETNTARYAQRIVRIEDGLIGSDIIVKDRILKHSDGLK